MEASGSLRIGLPSISEKLNQLNSRFEQKEWKKHCIYRVPRWVKGHNGSNDTHFRPRFVSIGPYYNGDSNLEAMQFHKYRVLDSMLKRTGKELSQVVDVVKNLESVARACYEDLPKNMINSDVFVDMLLLDGCFFVHFLELSCTIEDYHALSKEDPIFSKFYMVKGIFMDMMLLENQLPICILDGIYKVLFSPRNEGFLDLLFRSFGSKMVIRRPDGISRNKEMRSFLEALWQSHLYDSGTNESITKTVPSFLWEANVNIEEHVTPSVTKLKEAGVVFECKKASPASPFWDIEFNAGVLKIPQMTIHEFSEPIILNLMAYEFCHIAEGKHKITPFIIFMGSLVNSASDVAKLREQGIIVCAGPSDREIATSFNSYSKRVLFPFEQILLSDQYSKLSTEINAYCNKKRHKWRANLVHNYLNSPWAIISVFAASLLLILTFLQTSYTLAQYYYRK